jgi:hypothetical protein
MTAIAPVRPRAAHRELTISRKTLASLVIVAALWIPVPFLPADYRLVAAPASAILSISTLFLFTLWRWNRSLPVFEIGSIFGAVATLYAAVTAVNYLSAGLTWTLLSDGRLQYYNPGPAEVANFTWPYAGFLGAFAAAYLLVRRRRTIAMRPVNRIGRAEIAVAVMFFIAVQAILKAVELAVGITFEPSYLGGGLDSFSTYYTLPYFLQQILHNLVGWRFALKLILAAILLHRWRSSRLARWTLVGVLGYEILAMVLNMGSRTYIALLLLGVVFLYHRFIRPLTLRVAVAGSVLIIGGLGLFGAVRTVGGSLKTVYGMETRVWTMTTDFQTMWASAYAVQVTMADGTVGRPPWQAHLIDLVLLVPSQILPFAKVDPSAWYYSQIGATQSSMFGLRAQPVIGFGAPEFALRGAFLGVLFAALHRWYMRRSTSFWMTLFYVYCCLWAHYVFRSTMLWPLYFAVYQFLPVMLLVRFGAVLLRRVRRGASLIVSPNTVRVHSR